MVLSSNNPLIFTDGHPSFKYSPEELRDTLKKLAKGQNPLIDLPPDVIVVDIEPINEEAGALLNKEMIDKTITQSE